MSAPLLPFRDEGWHGLHTADMPIPANGLNQWLETLYPVVQYPARRILKGNIPSATVFVKLLTGVGDTPHALWPAIKWRLRPSRALRILPISRRLQDAGIHCAEVLLAARYRTFPGFGWPTDLIITRAVPGTSLRQLLRDNPDDTPSILALAIQALARLHAAGFSHGDCNPGNLFLDLHQGRVYFIDNDRTAPAGSAAFRKNLQQLGFHLLRLRLIHPPQWAHALRKYAGLAGWTGRETCRNLRIITDAIDSRLQREPPRPSW